MFVACGHACACVRAFVRACASDVCVNGMCVRARLRVHVCVAVRVRACTLSGRNHFNQLCNIIFSRQAFSWRAAPTEVINQTRSALLHFLSHDGIVTCETWMWRRSVMLPFPNVSETSQLP